MVLARHVRAMERLAALVVLSLALAGCTAPAPGPPGEAPAADAPPTGPPDQAPPATPRTEPAVAVVERPAPPAASPTGPADEAPPEPEPSATEAPASTAPQPAPPPDAPPPEVAPPDLGALPVLRVNDTWTYTGVNLSGGRYEEVRTVAGLGAIAGIPTYVLDITLNGAPRTLHVTRDGLNTVNETGVVTELLRFPLAAGKNWSFHWEQRLPVAGGGSVRQAVHGEVAVLALEKVNVAGTGYTAYHLHANITSSVGTLAKWTSLDYWYAPKQKTMVKVEHVTQSGQEAWSDLVLARLAPA